MMDRISPEEIARRRNSLRGGQSGEGAQQPLQDTEMPPPDAAAEQAPEIEGAHEAFRTLDAALGGLVRKVPLDAINRGEVIEDALSRLIDGESNATVRTALVMRRALSEAMSGRVSSGEEREKVRQAVAAVDGMSAALDAIVVQEKIEAPADAEVRAAFDLLISKLSELASRLVRTPQGISRDLSPVPAGISDPDNTNKSNVRSWLRTLYAVMGDVNVWGEGQEWNRSICDRLSVYLDPTSRTDSRDQQYLRGIREDLDSVPELAEEIDRYLAGHSGEGPEGSAEAGESLEARAREARDKIYWPFINAGLKLGIPMYPPTDENFANGRIGMQLRAVSETLERSFPRSKNLGRLTFAGRFDIDQFDRYIRKDDPFRDDEIERRISASDELATSLNELFDLIDYSLIDKALGFRIYTEIQQREGVTGSHSPRPTGDAPPRAPLPPLGRPPRAPMSARGDTEPESVRPELNIFRAKRAANAERETRLHERTKPLLEKSDPLYNQPLCTSKLFERILSRRLERAGEGGMLAIAMERARAIAVGGAVPEIPRRGKDDFLTLIPNEVDTYIRYAALEAAEYIDQERQLDGTFTFDSGDPLSYVQRYDEDLKLPVIEITVPRTMIANPKAIPAEFADKEQLPVYFEGVSLSEAIQTLIQQAQLIDNEGNPCAYSRAMPNPLSVPLAHWTSRIMAYVPLSPLWRRNRQNARETRELKRDADRARRQYLEREAKEARAVRDMPSFLITELNELERRGTIDAMDLRIFLGFHDSPDTDLRKPRLTPENARREQKVLRALEDLRAEPVLAQLRAKGLEQLPANELDILSGEDAIHELGAGAIDHYLQYLGSKRFSKFMKFARNSDHYRDYLVVQKYLDEHIERRELIAALEAGVGKQMRLGIEAERGEKFSKEERIQVEAREGHRIREALERRIGDRFTPEEYELFLGYYRLTFLQRWDNVGTRAERKAEKAAFNKVNAVLQALIGFNRLSDAEARRLRELESAGSQSEDDIDDYLKTVGGKGLLGSRLQREPVRRVANEMAGVRFESGFQNVIDTLSKYWKPGELQDLRSAVASYSKNAFAQGALFGDLNARKRMTEHERDILDRAAADFELISQWN